MRNLSLTAGTRFGTYEIVAALGAGGMGDVYRARDTRLNRDVAIKVLPDLFADDPERLARFEREAKTLASLNHPNIAQIYGFEDSSASTGSGRSSVCALVMELVEGPTLADRIARGRLPLEDALPVAVQIAEALEAAHEQGIIHRDLKPANIKVRPDGTVKVLDFGLAKALDPPMSSAPPDNSPTVTSPAMTQHGMILGTAAYMSPEQARGKVVDKRADIWAFGCVLYEMLTARRVFEGETVTDILAAIVTRDPDWSRLPEATPRAVRELVARCLDREPKRRLRDIGEARIVLGSAPLGSAVLQDGGPRPPAAAWRGRAAWGLAIVMAVVAGVAIWNSRRAAAPSPPRTVRFALTLPPDESLTFGELGDSPAVAMSPDGARVVYVARRGRSSQLYVRDLHRMVARLLAGTEGAKGPFFSPDAQWVGFFTDGALKKVPLTGGAPQVICVASPVTRGASWGPDNTIIFANQQAAGLVRVAATTRGEVSGERKAANTATTRAPLGPDGLPIVTSPDVRHGERAHLWPEILPGGKAVLFTIAASSNFDDALVGVQSLVDGERRVLIKGGSNAHYSPTGHLIYARAGTLLAAPFDLSRLEVTAPPATVVEGVRVDARSGAAHFSISPSGSLVYVPGRMTSTDRTLLWVDRHGETTPLTNTTRPYSYVSLSPDGRRLALTIQEANQDVWVHDLTRGSQTRLTFGPAENWGAIWTPDGRRVIFNTHGPHLPNLFWVAADGSGGVERLTTSAHAQVAASVSPDGQLLAFAEIGEKTASDIWLLSLGAGKAPRLHIGTPFDEYGPAFSPDGRWLAYVSTESGRREVYVKAFPGPGAKQQVSTDGGVAPVWGRDMRELFYRNGDRVLSAAISGDPELTFATPRSLFEGRFEEYGMPHWPRNYDIAAAGRFVMVKGSDEQPADRIDVVLDWFTELARRDR